jgi:hypothetical protein
MYEGVAPRNPRRTFTPRDQSSSLGTDAYVNTGLRLLGTYIHTRKSPGFAEKSSKRVRKEFEKSSKRVRKEFEKSSKRVRKEFEIAEICDRHMDPSGR